MRTLVLTLVGLVCLAATFSWARSARHRYRLIHRIDAESSPDDYTLAWSTFRKESHSAFLYGLLAVVSFVSAYFDSAGVSILFALVGLPALVSSVWARNSVREARMARQRIDIERRAQEALDQEDLAPKAWAARLAPEDLPEFSGFDV